MTSIVTHACEDRDLVGTCTKVGIYQVLCQGSLIHTKWICGCCLLLEAMDSLPPSECLTCGRRGQRNNILIWGEKKYGLQALPSDVERIIMAATSVGDPLFWEEMTKDPEGTFQILGVFKEDQILLQEMLKVEPRLKEYFKKFGFLEKEKSMVDMVESVQC